MKGRIGEQWEIALRIDGQVIRGGIDNSEHGCVVGRLWLSSRVEPIELDLAGDCWGA